MRLPNRPRILPFLNLVKLLLILLMVVMFIQFNARIAQQQAATRTIAQSTNNVVKGQADILKAIKEVTDDTHSTAAQQTAIIICMLQVPVSERTTDLQAQCRSSAAKNDSASETGGSAASNPSPSTSTPSVSGQAPSQGSSSSSSSTNPNTPPPPTQPNRLQRILNAINIFN